jgi:phenylacetate-CoA ligase
MARSIRAAGGRPGDILHVAYGYGLFTGGLGAHYGAEKLGCTVIPMSGGQTEKQVQLIRTSSLGDHGHAVVHAGDRGEMERQGIDPQSCSLEIGIFGAEPWTPTMRQAIEARLRMDAIDIYGLSEVIGPGVAQECIESKDGLTCGRTTSIPRSSIRQRRGAARRREGRARVHLAHQGSAADHPLPHARPDAPPAATARAMRRIEKITGRSDDMMIIRGVNVFPTQIEELMLKDPALAPHYQIEITRPGALDEMAVLVERVPSAGSVDGDAAGSACAPHQEPHRRLRRREGAATRRHRALARQGEAHRRQAAQVTSVLCA